MPEIRLVNAMQNQISQGDGKNEIFLLPTKEGFLFESLHLASRCFLAEIVFHVLIALGEKTASAASGIIDCLADLGVNDLNHGADDFARSEELTTVIVLLAHLQQ